MKLYAKAIVATIGSACTAATGIFPAHTTPWIAATIGLAAATTLGVYLVPNKLAK